MEEEEDRISQLPDPILQQILSSIDIKLAVQTSILSTRWKSLWLSLSDLRFHRNNRQSAQSHFVSHFLSHRDHATTLRTFHLSLDGRYIHADAPFIGKCALYVVNHGVESLHLHAPCRHTLRLPAAFLASDTLQELKLSPFTNGIYIPKNLSLPHLKTLHLEKSLLINDQDHYSDSKEPFSDLPELEKLTLRGYAHQEVAVFAPKLRFLEIIQEGMFSAVMEEISCPLLTSFRYEGYFPLECSRIDLPLLKDVFLNIYKEIGILLNEKRMPSKCVRMLQQLGNAEIVTLTLDTVKALEMDDGLIEQISTPPHVPYIKCLRLRKGRPEAGYFDNSRESDELRERGKFVL